jgi:dihydroorotate dehydrogenase (NAD+) catalytic subunit
MTPPARTLAVDLEGLQFPTPVLAASGCFNSGREMSRLLDLGKVGGIVTKSVTLAPTRGLSVPRMAETPAGMLNAIGLQNPGADEFLVKEGPWIASLGQQGVPVMVSVAGKSVEEYSQVTLRVKEIPGVVGLEANISCPNVERRNQVFACHPDSAAEVVGAMSRLTSLPVFAKLTADVTDVVGVAEACVRAGAHGLSMINTVLGMSVDVEGFRPGLGAVTGGLSGPAIRPIAIRCVYQVSRALPGVPVIGIGGIATGRDAIEMLMAGAWAVQVGTANFHNPQVMVEVAQGIGRFLAAKGLRDVAELRGGFSAHGRTPEPADRRG